MGEFGTKLGTESDAAWLRHLVGYLATNRMSFAYWSYNPNSGDTGGLVADDWRTPQQAKLDDLAPLLTDGDGAPPVPSPSPSRTVRSGGYRDAKCHNGSDARPEPNGQPTAGAGQLHPVRRSRVRCDCLLATAVLLAGRVRRATDRHGTGGSHRPVDRELAGSARPGRSAMPGE